MAHQAQTWPLRRVAMLSVHTSPLEQPGSGDAGGLNVYVIETARRLAERGTEVEIFTRATRSDQAPLVDLGNGVSVRHIVAGPFEGLAKEDLPAQLCAFAAGVMRVEARAEPGWYDLIHTHYWLSGQVGWLASERWNTPLVHTMHTMAKVKNASLAAADTPEPAMRIIGEEQVVNAADALVANTESERAELISLYGADPRRVEVISPGVDLSTFSPGGPDGRVGARQALVADADAPPSLLDPDAQLVLFVGRIQPLKAPDVLIRAVAELRARDAALGRRRALHVVILGGLSGSGLTRPDDLTELIRALDLDDVVELRAPVDRARLAQWYRAADLVAVPSYSESFGLVAVEAQACGTPVVAAAVGGLRTAVADQWSGVLVDGHDPTTWAQVLGDLLADTQRRDRLSRGAVRHSTRFSWEATTDALLEVYDRAIVSRRAGLVLPSEPPAGARQPVPSGVSIR